MSGLAREHRVLPFLLPGLLGPVRERNHNLTGPRTVLGAAPIQNRFRDITENEPAILFSIRRRAVLAKGHDSDRLASHLQALPVARSVAGSVLEMRKRKLVQDQIVAEAREFARELTAIEIKGPGDLEPAWRRLEARYGIPYSAFWSLRYVKDLKDVWASIHTMLRLAVEAERRTKFNNQHHQQTIGAIVRQN